MDRYRVDIMEAAQARFEAAREDLRQVCNEESTVTKALAQSKMQELNATLSACKLHFTEQNGERLKVCTSLLHKLKL